MEALLVSNFEGGYQPMTVATALTALVNAGIEVSVLDTYVDGIQEDKLRNKELIAISIPLFDSVQAAIELTQIIRRVNPSAHVTYFGQHATINANRLAGKYSDSCVCGEWEIPLVNLAKYLSGDEDCQLEGIMTGHDVAQGKYIPTYMSRNHFNVPTRHLLPSLYKYPQKQINKLLGSEQVVGSTEIARGCHHKCLYCSVYAAYEGKVLVIPESVILQDVQNLVEEGMTHLSFVDADFFNVKHLGAKILRKLHTSYPQLTYDLTTRIDHILENKEELLEMKELGVRFITSALEFPSELVLDEVGKNISISDIEEAVKVLREIGILLNPTFIMFNPWTRIDELSTFRTFVEENQLDSIIDPIQYETRLYLYKGSPLLRQASIQRLALTEHEFHYDWKHPDPEMDELFQEIVTVPEEGIFKRCCLKC